MLLLHVVVGVDLSKSVFEHSRSTGRARLTRSQYERWFTDRDVGTLVMEACAVLTTGVAGWQRWAEVWLLPARYVGAYVKRNKTNAADALRCYRRCATRTSCPHG